jgi:hypothetical protein
MIKGDQIPNNNGLLIHIIPEELITQNLINWENDNHKSLIKKSFHRSPFVDTIYDNTESEIIGFIPNEQYFVCFQNGIIEIFKHPFERENSFGGEYNYVKIDDIGFLINRALNSSKKIYQSLYNYTGPYFIVITFLGVFGTCFYSHKENFATNKPFPADHARFVPFQWNHVSINILPDIMNSIHKTIKESDLNI